jgi:hypothetical protein
MDHPAAAARTPAKQATTASSISNLCITDCGRDTKLNANISSILEENTEYSVSKGKVAIDS